MTRNTTTANLQLGALLGSGVLHAVLIGWVVPPSPPIATPAHQVIQLSLFTPDAQPPTLQATTTKAQPPAPPLSEKKNVVEKRPAPAPRPPIHDVQPAAIAQTPAIASALKPASGSLDKKDEKNTVSLPVNHDAQTQATTAELTSITINENINHSALPAHAPVATDALNNPPPHYPKQARIRNQQGTVLLGVRVENDGKPRDIRIAQSSGYPLLDQAALAAIRRWVFIPARQGNQPIAATIEIPITFRLEDG